MWGKTPENKQPSQTPKAPEPGANAPKPAAVSSAPAVVPPAPAPSYSAPAPAPTSAQTYSASPAYTSDSASRIGAGLKVHGVISGSSDLIVEGETNGKIYLAGARVIVAKTGKVQADIESQDISVDGSVQGNLKATDRIRLGATSNVQGSLVTPRIAIEDGARLRGKVEMVRASDAKNTEKLVSKPAEIKAAETKSVETKMESKADATPAVGGEVPNVRAAAARTQGD